VSEVRRETHVRRSLNARRSSQVQVRSQLVEDSPTDASLAGDSWSGTESTISHRRQHLTAEKSITSA